MFVKFTVRNIVEHKLEDLVNSYDLNNWQELIILLISNTKDPDNLQDLFEKLANKFAE